MAKGSAAAWRPAPSAPSPLPHLCLDERPLSGAAGLEAARCPIAPMSDDAGARSPGNPAFLICLASSAWFPVQP